MPERGPYLKPTFMAGTVPTSGDVNTGQFGSTQGGTRTASRMSGTAGGDVNLHVGGGRLDVVQLHPGAGVTMPAASGVAVTFYDSAVAVSGGPLNASGHKILCKINPAALNGNGNNALFNSGLLQYGSAPVPIGIPFTSGLCAVGQSGQAGWTVTFTPAFSG